MIKRVAILIGKVSLLYLLFLIVWADAILIMVASPRIIVFEIQPFLQMSCLVIIAATATSIKSKSPGPILWAASCLAYTCVFVFFSHYVFSFLLFLFFPGAISFIYRNRFTEPLLVLLPIISGAWLFLTLIYSPCFVGWAYYVTGKMDLLGALHQGLTSLNTGSLYYVGNVLPFLAVYFLAKRGHIKLYSLYQARSLNPSINTDADLPPK